MKKAAIIFILTVFIFLYCVGCSSSQNQSTTATGGISDETFETIVPDESETNETNETMKINIDGVERTLYLYDSVPLEDYYTLNPSIKNYPIAVLTNAVINSVSPTLVKEGDMFLNWKVGEITSRRGNYICFDDGRMYYNGDTMIQFEGEVKVTANVCYGYVEESAGADREEYLFIVPDEEYRELFPEIIFEYGDWVSFRFYNHKMDDYKNILELIDYKYGEYEIEMTIKDYYLFRVPTEGSNKAVFTDMKILSFN